MFEQEFPMLGGERQDKGEGYDEGGRKEDR